jgi:hypothetical protein
MSEDSHEDDCGVCGTGGNLICCDACPLAFHGGCIGYHSLDIIGDDDSWYCWMCSKMKKKNFRYDTTPVKFSIGDTVYVSLSDECIEYVPTTLENVLSGGNKLRFKISTTGDTLFARVSSKRIWRGDVNKYTLVGPGKVKKPAFHDVAVDFSKKKEYELFLEKKKASKSQHASPSKPSQQSQKSKDESKKRKAEASTSSGKKNKVMKSPVAAGSKAPLSDNSAANVLKTLANLPSQKEPAKKSASPVEEPRIAMLQMTEKARNISKGDIVEVWMNATKKSPGGWVAGTVCEVCILEAGALPPYFAFILVSFNGLKFPNADPDRELYREWRTLALPVQSENSLTYQIQVRIPQEGRRDGPLTKGTRVEAFYNGVNCPGTIEKVQQTRLFHVAFDDPCVNSQVKSVAFAQSVLRLAHKDEKSFHGMLGTAP